MKTSLLIFTLNEIDGMKNVWPKIDKQLFDQILVVDGGSVDGTLDYLEENKIDYFIQRESGTGAAFCESLPKITGDCLIVFSPDGNSMPEKLPNLIDEITATYADIVICSRYATGAKSYDDDIVTKFGNWMFTSLFNFLYNTTITDVLVMYRAYKMDKLLKLNITPNSDAWGTQIMARAAKNQYRIAEIPGDEPKRIGGVRKMSPVRNGWMELKMMAREVFK